MSEQVLAGSLTDEELSNFVQARNVATNLLREIGALEVQKTRILMQIDQNESSAQAILDGAKDRLGLESDVPFRVQNDGQIFTIKSDEESPET
jgi:hypothetical protein